MDMDMGITKMVPNMSSELLEENAMKVQAQIREVKLEKGIARLNCAGLKFFAATSTLLTLSAGYLSIVNQSWGYGLFTLLGGCGTAFLLDYIKRDNNAFEKLRLQLQNLSLMKQNTVIDLKQLREGLKKMDQEGRHYYRKLNMEFSYTGMWSTAELFLLFSLRQNPTAIMQIAAGIIPLAIADHVLRLRLYQKAIQEVKQDSTYWESKLPLEEQSKMIIK